MPPAKGRRQLFRLKRASSFIFNKMMGLTRARFLASRRPVFVFCHGLPRPNVYFLNHSVQYYL